MYLKINDEVYDVGSRGDSWCKQTDTCSVCNGIQRRLCAEYMEAWRKAGCPIETVATEAMVNNADK